MFNNLGTTIKGGFRPGSNNTIENPQGFLYCAPTTVSKNGEVLTVKWAITPKAGFEGAEKVHLLVRDTAKVRDGFNQVGTWTVTGIGADAEPSSSKRVSLLTDEQTEVAPPSHPADS